MSESSVIFLSSTVEDMQEERNAVEEVVTKLRQNISRCEYFPARSKSPKEVCLEEARTCDIFIGIYKNQYGSIPEDGNPEHISVTEMEYNEARDANRPILIFYQQDSKKDKELDSFLKKTKQFSKGHYVMKYRNLDELKFNVLLSLVFNLRIISKISSIEKNALEGLIPDEIKYQKVLLNQFEYTSPTGIAKPSALIQYRIKDLFVSPELIKYVIGEDDKKNSDDDGGGFTLLSIQIFGSASWNEMEKFVNEDKKNSSQKITTGIDILDKIKDQRPLVILGDAGSGKSTLMKYLCTDLILNSSIIPFFIQIKDFESHLKITNNESIIEYLAKKYRELNLNKEFFYNRLNAGSTIILFDGLDEVWETKERNRINEIIQQFCATWSTQNKIIITSRISGYFQNQLVGNIEVLKLKPFGKKQIGNFIHKWANLLEENKGENVNKRTATENAVNLQNLVFADVLLTKLASSPLILIIICLAFMKNLSFPKRKHALYSMLIETLLTTWDQQKGIELSNFDWTDFVKILRHISFTMFNSNKLQVNQEELQNLIRAGLEKEDFASIEIKQIRDIINRLEERSGIFISDGMGNYSFFHLSFMEYFVAEHLSQTKEIHDIFKYFENSLHNPKNQEVISFVSSMLSDKSRTESSAFLDLILNSNTILEDLHAMNLMLVIRCMSAGALISEVFMAKIIQDLDIKWDLRRNNDDGFFHEISNLISTPYEKNIVNLWRIKYQSNIEFYEAPLLTSLIIRKEEYFEDLVKGIELDMKKEREISEAILIMTSLMQSDPYQKLIKYVKDNLEKFDTSLFLDGILFGMAVQARSDEQLKEWFFQKIDSTDINKLKLELIKYSGIIDKTRAELILQKLPDSVETGKLKKNLLKENNESISDHDKLMKILSGWLSQTPINDDFSHSQLRSMIENSVSYDQEFLEALIQGLKTISSEENLAAYRICRLLSTTYAKFEDSRKTIVSTLTENDDKVNRWTPYIQQVILKTIPPNNEIKEILIKSLLDINENPIIRRGLLNTLMENFSSDNEVIKINSKLLLDVDLLGNASTYLVKYPDELKNNISNIVTLSNKKECIKAFGNLARLLREYITTIQK